MQINNISFGSKVNAYIDSDFQLSKRQRKSWNKAIANLRDNGNNDKVTLTLTGFKDIVNEPAVKLDLQVKKNHIGAKGISTTILKGDEILDVLEDMDNVVQNSYDEACSELDVKRLEREVNTLHSKILSRLKK